MLIFPHFYITLAIIFCLKVNLINTNNLKTYFTFNIKSQFIFTVNINFYTVFNAFIHLIFFFK